MQKLNAGLLRDAYRKATDAFLYRVDPAAHAAAYEGEHDDTFAESEFAGKYLDTCVTYARFGETRGDRARARRNADAVAAGILRNQRKDGYLGGLRRGREWEWFGVWNQAFTVYGLLSYYELTKKPSALKCAMRAMDYIEANFGDGKRDILDAINNGTQHASVLFAATRLYRTAKREKDAEFIRYIVRRFRESDLDYVHSRDILKLRSRKGIESFVILVGLLDYADLFGDGEALEGCRRYWEQVAKGQIREDGNGTLSEFWSERGNAPRYLDLSLKPNENCVAVGWMEFSLALFFRFGDKKYLDAVDVSLYNHFLGAMAEDGGDFAYYQPNFGRRVTRKEPGLYQCCRYRGFSMISNLNRLLFRREGSTVSALLFTNGSFADGGVRVTESTRYPFDDTVRFRVTAEEGAEVTALRVRVPASAGTVKLDGGAVTPDGDGWITIPLLPGETNVRISFGFRFRRKRGEIDGAKVCLYTRGPVLMAGVADAPWDEIAVSLAARAVKTKEKGRLLSAEAGGTRLSDYASSGRAAGESFTMWMKVKPE